MAINPALALQAALRERLLDSGDLTALLGGPRVFDDPPQGHGFPYVCFGEFDTRDWSTQTARGHEHIVTLNIWSKERGRREAQAIIAAIDDALDGAALGLEDHTLVSLRVVFWTATRAPDAETYRGLMRLRAVTEPEG